MMEVKEVIGYELDTSVLDQNIAWLMRQLNYNVGEENAHRINDVVFGFDDNGQMVLNITIDGVRIDIHHYVRIENWINDLGRRFFPERYRVNE